jgi:acetyltransferase-like isoleucine patch superfamily enzyme
VTVRSPLKRIVFSVSAVLVSPLVALAWIERRALRSEGIFVAFAQLLALAPGQVGSYLRGAYYYGTLSRCSWETHIGFGSVFMHRGASVGPRTSMGAYCVIGHANIGEEVMMGSRVSIPSGKRQHLDDAGKMTSSTKFETVTIGDLTWVGEGAIVMADVGKHSIVSAGAVVTKIAPANSLIGGNPASVIRELDRPRADRAIG